MCVLKCILFSLKAWSQLKVSNMFSGSLISKHIIMFFLKLSQMQGKKNSVITLRHKLILIITFLGKKAYALH